VPLRLLDILFLLLSCLLLPVAVAASAGAAPAPTFDLLEFEVEGNTVLDATTVEHALLPHMGPGRSIADVEAARSALERAFQEAGWLTVLVDLPEQPVLDGVVRLVVTEGRVGRLRVTGSRYYDQGRIRAVANEVAEGRVPNFNTLQNQLAELNRTPLRQVQPVLRQGAEPGTVEVELKVADQSPLSFSAELNNRHAADTKPLRLVAGLRWDNLLQREHSVALTAITAPQAPEQSRVLVASYTVPEPAERSWTATLVASDSRLEPLGAGTVIGRGLTLGLRRSWSHYTPDSAHTLVAGADYKNLSERFLVGDAEISTPLRYLPLQLQHSGQWQHGSGDWTTLTSTFTFALSQVLERRVDCPGNVGPVDQFACRRQGADGGFAWLRLDARHNLRLPLGSLALRLGGQLATQPLVGGEQYSLGGAETVRGYYEGEAVGDLAALAAAEWRSPNLAAGATGALAALSELTLLVFAEAGRTTVLDPLPEQAAHQTLAGSGVGLRLRSGRLLAAELDLAWPLRNARGNPDRDPRWHARLGLSF
jgi:hemolysin activation/secretion protein